MTSRLTEEELVRMYPAPRMRSVHVQADTQRTLLDELRAARARLAELEPVMEAACGWRQHNAAECDGCPRDACGCSIDLEHAVDAATEAALTRLTGESSAQARGRLTGAKP